MISWKEILIRLLFAALFGAIVGLERERKRWSSAGMRTHMMVCVGSCLVMLVSAFGFHDALTYNNVVLDPSRVAAQVISGIGFIGAGTIVLLKQTQTHIKGLTTAAGLWTVAAVGLATGGGMFFAAGITTLIALFILWVLQPVEKKFLRRYEQRQLRFVTSDPADMTEAMGSLVFNKHVVGVHSSIDPGKKETHVYITFRRMGNKEFAEIVKDIQSHIRVKEISWEDNEK
ncbi:MAG: MgtC/SapB family protein [Chitinophagaceae bacterium]|nr:MgtC/SapB family protein [Chitinophagaceae bacterium]